MGTRPVPASSRRRRLSPRERCRSAAAVMCLAWRTAQGGASVDQVDLIGAALNERSRSGPRPRRIACQPAAIDGEGLGPTRRANSEPVDVLATSRTMGLHPVADRFNATGTLLGDIFDAVDRALAAARFVLGPTARALAPGPRRSPRWHSPPSPRRTLPDARGPLRRVRSQLHDTHEDDHDAHAWSPTVVPVSPPNLSRATHPPAACR